MRKEQKEIDDLGPIGIFREAFKIFFTHYRFCMLIQLTLMLPLAIFIVATNFFTMSPKQNAAPSGGSLSKLSEILSKSSELEKVLVVVVVLLVTGVYLILGAALKGLSSSAILYAVGLNYVGQRISYMDVLQQSLPYVWMRLTITNIYGIFLIISIGLAQFLCILALGHIGVSVPILLLAVATIEAFSLIGLGFVELVFTVGAGVSVLEKDYGWAAVRRARKLLKGRVLTAILFLLLFILLAIVTVVLHLGFRYVLVKPNYSLPIVMLAAVADICWMTFYWQLQALCAGVQYVSFKAYHNEDLEETLYEKQITKGTYGRVGQQTDDAKVGGKHVDPQVL